MIICPWCGTNYLAFQHNCRNCGGPLPAPRAPGAIPAQGNSDEHAPPPAPRAISDQYIWRLLASDGWAMAGMVFLLLGFIFSTLGVILTIAILTAFVGIPFTLIGLGFLAAGLLLVSWRYDRARMTVRVLRDGMAVKGRLIEVREETTVRINRRHPWVIRYRFSAGGKEYEGSLTTLRDADELFPEGSAMTVLYLDQSPEWNTLYPHP